MIEIKLKKFTHLLKNYKRYENKEVVLKAPNGILMEPCIRLQCKDPMDMRVNNIEKVVIYWE